MNRLVMWFGLLLMCVVYPAAGEGPALSQLPPLQPKPYAIGIAPSHITTDPNPMFASTSQWQTVVEHTDLYKYYGVQLLDIDWSTNLDAKAFVACMKQQEIRIGCEFGSFGLGGDTIPDPAQAAFNELDPIYDAGGEVYSLHLDGPIRRMIKGFQDHPNAQSMDQIAARLVDFYQKVHAKYPDIRIGLITNFPNWDYTAELVGYNGHYTDTSGVTYAQALDTLYEALRNAGEKIAFIEVDCPYNYYKESRTRNSDAPLDNATKFIKLQKWCNERDIRFHMIVNAEPRGTGGKGFHDMTCTYIKQLRNDGIFPDLFLIQSWYKQPEEHLPESEPNTFMNTASDAIELIRDLYPTQ